MVVNRLNSLKLTENFLYSGLSALILSLTQFYPELRVLAIIALAPFLIRIIKVNHINSIYCGIILSFCLAMVLAWGELFRDPIGLVIKFGLLGVVFSAFAVAVKTIKKHFGFNPVFVAALWLPLEYVLKHLAGLNFAFIAAESGNNILIGLSSLFGLLFVSFIILLINSLIVALIEYVASNDIDLWPAKPGNKACRYKINQLPFISSQWYYPYIPRSPPL
jgi:apolipoprotein N-acyltransferase